MNLDGIEVVGIVPNLLEINSQVVNFASTLVSIGGPNGSGKSELLRRVAASFSGDATELENDVHPGLLVKLKNFDTNSEEVENKFAEDRFIQNLYSGILENLNWRVLKSSLEEVPEDIEQFEAGLASVLVMSIKMNFSEQLTDSLKIMNKKVSHLTENRDKITSIEMAKIEKYMSIIEYIQTNVHGNKEFLSNFAAKFLQNYELLLVPVGSKDRPEWNGYIVNRELSQEIDEISAIMFINSPNEDYFSENPTQQLNLCLKREIGVSLAGRYESKPWFLINIGRIQAQGFVIINPDRVSTQEMKVALNQSASKSFNWYQIRTSLAPEIEPEKKQHQSIQKMLNLLNSFDQSRVPKLGESGNSDFFTVSSSGDIDVSSAVYEWLSFNSKIVNDILKEMLPTIPDIKLDLNDPSFWATDGIFNLIVNLRTKNMPLESLSETQQRWVKFILAFSLFSYNDRRVIILDEPELGLQRNLENNIFDLLSLFASNSLILTSTHSSVFLKSPQVIGIQQREDHSRFYTSYLGSLYAHLHEFDISEAEYFESFKLLVVTEGERDKAMLEGFAGDIFEENQILLVAGTGIKSWEGFFTSHIFPMLTSPKIVFLVDGFDPNRMKASIAEGRKLIKKGHPAVKFYFRDAIPLWSQGVPLGKGLTDSFAESLTRALISKDSDRIYFEATGDRDCIEWLPVSTFPLNESNWDDVWKSASSMSEGKITTGEDFKNYVKQEIKKSNPRLNLKPESLKEMAAMASIQGNTPKRISKLISRLVELSK